jgi:hypothetical protein
MPAAGIDTRFVLALYALGTQSFGNGRTAALPRPAVGFALAGLRFFPPAVAEDLERAHQFALQVNSRIVPPSGTAQARLLWDEYEEVLDPTAVRLAERQPTTEETERYDAARAFLTADVLAAYNTGTQALGAARLELGTVKANQPAPDAAGFEVWEARLRAATDRVRAAEVDLLVRCEANRVEAAIATVQGHPAATAVSWSRHSDAFELAKSGSLDGGTFLFTTFAPSDVVDGRGWTSFELLPDRIDELLAGLGALAADAGGDDGRVRRMTVALTHVVINRPWFDPGVFRSNAWRFADPQRPPVSDGMDGGTAAGGSFPYLVTGLVLARSLRVEFGPAPAGQPEPPLELGYLDQIEFNPGLRGVPGRATRFRVAPRIAAARDPGAEPAIEAIPVAPAIQVDVDVGRLPATLLDEVRATDFPSPDPPSPDPPGDVPPAPPPDSTTLVGDDELIVVAYLLEPVGRAPHPDPGLTWPAG